MVQPVQVGEVVLGAGRAKVIVPLLGADGAELAERGAELAARAAEAGADLVEWRVDALADLSPAAVVDAARVVRGVLAGLPLLVTVRTTAEGGDAQLDAGEYTALLRALLGAQDEDPAGGGLADLLDVELSTPTAQREDVLAAARAARVPVVMSSHDFHATPPQAQMVARLEEMEAAGADVLKLAVMPADAGDVLALAGATWEVARRSERPVITMAMGGLGVVSRLTGQTWGSCATFAALGQVSAPGQVAIEKLVPVLHLVDEALSAQRERR